ncbi:mitotic spindle checkpoint protein Bub3 [Saxophila tyrrhenica]|uniref:Mitotic spindle checkpoint protein Bub3 n=1 Tax=Saxophila tyrrhenica TaxID=1690608 RepID=A0AAV9NYY2_9PEZI|nr:mitotic spindle checkpoint protein Bub3 [Saxophila tyrrhenica]
MGSLQELPDPPSDALTSLRWSHDGNSLLVGSWGKDVRVYRRNAEDRNTFSLQHKVTTEYPRLDVCWGKPGSNVGYAVGVERDVRQFDFDAGTQSVLSSHDEPSNKVDYSPDHNVLISTSWDGTMHVHDPDSGRFISVRLAAKPLALSLTAERVVVAMVERKVSIYDLKALRTLLDQTGNTAEHDDHLEIQPWQERDSSLKFMTRAVACMPDGTGFVTSSIEGRVGVEWFNPETDGEAYAFKCHRQVHHLPTPEGGEEEVDVVYPVNALAFHPTFGTFATGGGDGGVALWDAKTKRRVRVYQNLEASVAALDISPDGKSLAIAISPGFEESKFNKAKEEGRAVNREDGTADPKEYFEQLDSSRVKIVVREFAEGEAKAKPKEKKAKGEKKEG